MKIAHLSHIGGLLHGFVFGTAIVRNVNILGWEKYIRVLFFTVASLSYICFIGIHFLA